MDRIQPCTHEEVDTRLLLHALDAQRCYQHIKIRNNDTDVVVLAVSSFRIIDAEHLWVAYGTGKTLKYIHQIASMLTQEEAEALPLFQAITGCDTVSYFCGCGKRTTWEVHGYNFVTIK